MEYITDFSKTVQRVFEPLQEELDINTSQQGNVEHDEEQFNDEEQMQHDYMHRLPNEIMIIITKILSKRDYVQCTHVSKSWFALFFGSVYQKIHFKRPRHVSVFKSLLECAVTWFSEDVMYAMAVSVIDVTLDNEVDDYDALSYYNNETIDCQQEICQLFQYCRNIKTLRLSWKQFYTALNDDSGHAEESTNDNKNNDSPKLFLSQLHYLQVNKKTIYLQNGRDRKELLVSTYPKQDDGFSTEFMATTNNNNSSFEKPEYLLHFMEYTPMLENLSLGFTATKDRPWINEQHLEVIHHLCPYLQKFRLDNAALYISKSYCSFIEGGKSSATGYLKQYPIAEKMNDLVLKNPVFYTLNGWNLLQYYLKHKYNAISLYKSSNITVLIDITTNNISSAIRRSENQKSAIDPISTSWNNIKEISLHDISTVSAFAICRSIIHEAGCPTGRLTYIQITGKYIKKNRMIPIVIDLAWIQEACPTLKELGMKFFGLYCNGEQDTMPINYDSDQPFNQGTFFRYLRLERSSSTAPWEVQSYKLGFGGRITDVIY
ncbi:hypothetical protein BDA99DRAFT_543437 [Phascolomyces articulosus]|uniref:F-box domain-containing protein n=1 Tax=Phascolomyces articulosus TaxID=60185 RepID=A0AAD5JNE3_9FUNG|nr:hypothetical protein BDA99DRAFT_543437 [Phascolomyces articulosus]